MDASSAYKTMLRDDVGRQLRALGFKGTAPQWIKTYPDGEFVMIRPQSSDMSSRADVWFTVNWAFFTESWLNHVQGERPPFTSLHGVQAVFSGRINAGPTVRTPPRRPDWWSIRDSHDATSASTDVLAAIEGTIMPNVERLLDPATLKAELRADNRKQLQLAVFLAEHGPSDELETVLDDYVSESTPRTLEWTQRTVERIRQFALRTTASAPGVAE